MIVEAIGPDVPGFKRGDEVYGTTNDQLTGHMLNTRQNDGAETEDFELFRVGFGSRRTVTAWQMLFDYARVTSGQTVLVHGTAGNVGAYAVQLARQAGLRVVATTAAANRNHVTALGAEKVIDYRSQRFEDFLHGVDIVLDTVGGDTQERSCRVLKPGGILVSAVSPIPETLKGRYGVRAAYFYVDVTTERLNKITELFDSGKLVANVRTVLPLEKVRIAHEMLGGAPRKGDKIVLNTAA